MINSNDKRVVSFYNDMSSKPRDDHGHYVGSVQNATGLLYVIKPDSPAVHIWLPVELEQYSNAASGSSGERAGGIRLTGFSTIKAAADFVVKVTSSPEEIAKFLNESSQDNIYGAYGLTRATRARKARVASVIVAVDPRDRPMSSYSLKELYGQDGLTYLISKHSKTAKNDYNVLTRGEFESRYNLVAVDHGEAV